MSDINPAFIDRERLEILQLIDTGIIEARSLSDVLHSTLRHLKRLIPFDAARVSMLDAAGNFAVSLAAETDEKLPFPNGERVPVLTGWYDVFGDAPTFIIENLVEYVGRHPIYRKLVDGGLKSTLQVKLRGPDGMIGLLGLGSRSLGVFTQDHAALAADVGNRIAIAIRHIQLDDEVRHRSRELEQMVEGLKLAEQEIQRSEARYRSVVDLQTDRICRYDPNFRLTFVNRAYAAAHDRDPDSMIGAYVIDLIPPEDRQHAIEHVRSLSIDNPVATSEHRSITPDGSLRWHHWTDIAIFDSDGNIVEYQGVGRDITERQLADEALREARETLERRVAERTAEVVAAMGSVEAILNNSLDGIVLVDSELNIRRTNAAFDRMIDAGGAPACRSLLELIFDDEMERFKTAVDAILGQNAGQRLELRLRRGDGSTFDAEVSLGPIRGVGLVCTVHDITVRKATEQVLQEKAEEERRFQHYLRELHDITIELTQIEDLDEFYRQTVLLGRGRLGFDRLAIFRYDPEDGSAVGLYGTAPNGSLSDERHIRFQPSPEGVMMRSFRRTERFAFQENARLYTGLEETGEGWNVAAVLWNGVEKLGWLTADNATGQEAAFKPQLEIMSLYALTIGTLLGRKQIDAERRESEEKFRRLLDAGPVATVITDEHGDITLINEQAEMLFGYRRAELLGQPVEILLPEILRAKHVHERGTYVAAPHRRPTPVGAELFARHRDGSLIPVEIELGFIQTNAGLLVMSFVLDITERKQAAAALEQQRTFLQQVIDVSPNMIYVKDYDSRFVLVNPMVAKVIGTTVEELIGKRDTDILPVTEEVQFMNAKDRRVIETGEPVFVEEPLTNNKGETVWLQTTKVPILSADGKTRHVLGVSTDITERKKNERAIREALEREKELGELKSRFISMASHEFRTPLATILVLTETLMAYRRRLNDAQVNERLVKIQEQVGHLRDIMEDVLYLARLQARRAEFNPVPLDLRDLVQSVIEEHQSQPGNNHQLVFRSGEPFPMAALDKKLMRQILGNLLSNALKYSKPQTTVTVELEQDGDEILIHVSDQGIGIPEPDLKHLFDAFHRADNVGTISGTGLGLTIARESVELHGGKIDVESELGVGTRFTVRIPINGERTGDHAEDSGH